MSDLLNRIDLRFDFVSEKLAEHSITEEGCWEYNGYKNPLGYGEFKIYCATSTPKKRKFRASRVAYAFYNGVDPGELYVCHRCDNPSCINPDHLFLGTPMDNTQDMIRKGRNASQCGESNNAAKISESIVIDVIAKIREGKNNKQIAAELPICHSMVSLIRLGKTWRHVLQAANYDPNEYRRFIRNTGS